MSAFIYDYKGGTKERDRSLFSLDGGYVSIGYI